LPRAWPERVRSIAAGASAGGISVSIVMRSLPAAARSARASGSARLGLLTRLTPWTSRLPDRLDGGIATILDRKRTLDPGEACTAAAGCLDAYVNQAHRSLKSYRDGRDATGHLDAAESVPYALEVLFALHRRVRPYNKYVRWEPARQPLGEDRWRAERLLPMVRRILADGDPHTQRALFGDIERAARVAGHGEVLDSWGDDLRLLRPR